LPLFGQSDQPLRVSIRIDTKQAQGPLKPIYSFFGYDEPNYTYMKDGKKLLSQLAAGSPVPVYVRVHNLLTSGDGTAALKWGSTNAYTEDASERPRYDWTIVDRIFDTLSERRMKPLVEIGFMPEALSTKPQPYRHSWAPDQPYRSIFTGWAYPPKDYGKWAELIHQWCDIALKDTVKRKWRLGIGRCGTNRISAIGKVLPRNTTNCTTTVLTP
jgi:xylan 1,4-beta-xylosidase